MKKYFIFLIVFFMVSCFNTDVKKYVQTKEKEFQPTSEINEPLIFESYNLIIFPITQNYIKYGSELYKIAIKEKYSKFASLTDKSYINFKWREIDDIDGGFNSLFNENIVVLDYFSKTDNYGSKADKLIPYILFYVIEKDTNGDKIFSDDLDKKTLYIFNLFDKKLEKIVPDNINVQEIKYNGFYLNKISTNNIKLINSGNLTHSEINLENFIILFKGVEDKNYDYIYHLRNKRIERLNLEEIIQK